MTATLVDMSSRVAEYIHRRLSTDSTLSGLISTRLYRGQAPEGAVYPFVTHSEQSDEPFAGLRGPIMATEHFWLVKINGKGTDDITVARPIVDRVLQLLHEAPAQYLSGVRIAECRYARSIPQPDEVIGGERYYHVNLQFKIRAYPSTS